MPDPAAAPSRGEVIEVAVEKIVFGGDGLARLPSGFVVFIPFAAAGDHLRVRIAAVKAGHARAEIVAMLEPGPHRVAPPCPYYGRCGGCQYQHLDYAEELRLKQEQVREAFARQAKMPDAPLRSILPSPRDYGYRNRITVHAEPGALGFRATDGRTLVDIAQCLLAAPSVNAELARLRAARPAEGHYSVRDPAIPPSGFHQANQELAATLPQLVAEALPARGDVLLEGYCGGGYFTRSVANRFGRVVAIDNDARSLLDARRLGLNNVAWTEADVAEVFPRELAEIAGGDAAVLVDPPREGLPVRVTEALALQPVAHLVYVSCNPATLARDARMLAGSYRLISVQPLDAFPRTAQIECVSAWAPR